MLEPKKRFENEIILGGGKNDFEHDYTAILYSHAFRRLKHKTQVFFYAQNDHVCTRLDHSLYVSAISEVVCRNLQLKKINCDPMLARAIGIGHDLGHTPFGHAGEEYLDRLASGIGGFGHEIHSLRIVDKIENPRSHGSVIGLNLTLAVRDGIVNHCGEDRSTCLTPNKEPDLNGNSIPATVEGCVVRLVDKIAYLGRDLEDAVIAGLLKENDVPGEISAKIGSKNGEIVDFFVVDLINTSNGEQIALSQAASELMDKLMNFNYARVYRHEQLEPFKKRVEDVLNTLFKRFMTAIEEYDDRIDLYLSDSLKVVQVLGKFIGDRKRLYFDEEAKVHSVKEKRDTRIIVDFLATLTDNFVFQACSEYFLPEPII